MLYFYIYQGLLQNLTVEVADTLAIPPGASAIVEPDWIGMCTAAGSEAALLEQLEVTDMRGGDDEG